MNRYNTSPMDVRVRAKNNSPIALQGNKLAAVTPNDSADVTIIGANLYIGTSGDVNVQLVGDDTPVVLKNMAEGVVHPIQVKRIWSTDTTATDMVLVYEVK